MSRCRSISPSTRWSSAPTTWLPSCWRRPPWLRSRSCCARRASVSLSGPAPSGVTVPACSASRSVGCRQSSGPVPPPCRSSECSYRPASSVCLSGSTSASPCCSPLWPRWCSATSSTSRPSHSLLSRSVSFNRACCGTTSRIRGSSIRCLLPSWLWRCSLAGPVRRVPAPPPCRPGRCRPTSGRPRTRCARAVR